MNQIINIDLNKNIEPIENTNTTPSKCSSYKKNLKVQLNKKVFNIQFFLSVIAIIIFISLSIYSKISLNNKEGFSDLLINNYSITKLYSNNNITNTNKESLQPNSIIGIIEIPTLNIYYPIFYNLSDELLKISPCRFYGDFPSNNDIFSNTNLCIAGHNYDNGKFFSDIKKLKINNEIFLFDNLNNKYLYKVIKNYEVKSDDFSPVYKTLTSFSELTLVTCNNFNGNRIIIKAQKQL